VSTGYVEFWGRTRIHCAVGAVVRLPTILQGLGARRVLLLSDRGLASAGLVDRVQQVFALNRSGNLPELAGTAYDGATLRQLMDMMIAAGADAKAVQHLLGHATASMTMDLYGHLFSIAGMWLIARHGASLKRWRGCGLAA